jgi:hypothetical protein
LLARLPGEGIYGFRIVLQNGVGRSSPLPQAGDIPDLRLEIDLTAPKIELLPPGPDPSSEDTLILRWKAEDKNLADLPIRPEWSTDGDKWYPFNVTQPWVANTGEYRWKVSDRIPKQVYLRLIAKDKASNLGEARSKLRVVLDLIEPEGRLTGVEKMPEDTRPPTVPEPTPLPDDTAPPISSDPLLPRYVPVKRP